MNIDSQQSVFNKARKDKFLLVLTLPAILKGIDSPILTQRSNDLVQLEALQFSIWGSPVPETAVNHHQLLMQGQAYNVTSQHREPYPPITVNFTIDNRFGNWWVLWKWLDILNNIKDSGMPEYFDKYEEGTGKPSVRSGKERERAYLEQQKLANKASQNTSSELELQQINMVNNFLDYQTIITIYALDEYNSKIARFDYTNAFITKLGGIDYNYRNVDEAESSFTFVFNQLHIKLINDATT